MPARAQVLRALFFLAAVAVLAYSLYLAYQVTAWTTLGLMGEGWAQYLGRPSATPLMFTFFCLSEGLCKQIYSQAWLQSYPLLVPSLALVPLSAAALITVFGAGDEQKKSPGGARWAKERDLRVLIRGEKGKGASPLRGYLGLTVSGRMLRVPERLRNSHTLVVGGPGARKSTGYYKPNMLMDVKDKSSGIIIDLKYPDTKAGFFGMVKLYERAGFDVQLYLPFSDNSLRLPLLGEAERRQGAYEIAEMVVPGGSQEDAASFYRAQERQLMAGLVMGLAREGIGSLRRLYNLLMGGMSELQRYVRNHSDPEVRRMLAAFFELEGRLQAGIIAGLYGRLQVFDNDQLDRATTVSAYPWENIDLEGIGARPSLLYIGIPQEHLLGGRGQALLQLIKRTVDRALIRTANAHGGQLPVHTSFYLDEFRSLGPLPNVGEIFATMRSRRVAYHVTLQNRAQVEAIYGVSGARELLTNNFQHTLIFPRYLKGEDADYFSKTLGNQTSIDTAKGRSRTGWFEKEQRSETKREVARPLLSPEEMTDWPAEVGVLLANGTPPAKVLVPRLDEKRVMGKKNPLHRFSEYLTDEVDPKEVASAILAERTRRGIKTQAATPRPDEAEGVSELATAQTQPRNEGPASGPHIAQNLSSPGVQEAFLQWVDKLIERRVAVVIHRSKDREARISKITLLQSDLPQSLANPRDLNAWTSQGWVKWRKTKGEVGIVGEGLELLGQRRIAAFEELMRIRSDRGEATQRHVQSAAGTQQVRAAKEQPLFPESALSSVPEAETIKAADSLRSAPSPEQDGSRQGIKAEEQGRASLLILEGDALTSFKRWLPKSAHLLKDHPARGIYKDADEAPPVIGSYQERTVFLVEDEVQRLFEGVPEGLRRVRKGPKGAQRWMYAIPDPLLSRLEPLQELLEKKAHLLAGHPCRKMREGKSDPPPAIGVYQERVVSLPREELERITGCSFEGVRQRKTGRRGEQKWVVDVTF